MAFERLLTPIQINNVILKNRIIMGSMHVGFEEAPGGENKLAAFYAERARGHVGLIVTGGFGPNQAGRVFDEGADLVSEDQLPFHRVITEAVHKEGGAIAFQILHAGRYSYQEGCVAPSPLIARINVFRPRELSHQEILQTIDDYARCAHLAKQAGYDGVEVMGSEGYLINQFIAKRTNHRTDEWGGTYENRIKFSVQIVDAVRKAVGKDFIIIYRLSCLDLVEDGSTFEEVVELAKRIEQVGASVINTGIGWHESKIPTIAMSVPRAPFSWVTKKLRPHLNIPVITSNRINDPYVAENLLRDGVSDMVSMARPFLADSEFVLKVEEGRVDEINTCIACNQACLDHVFAGKPATCLVNPRAGREEELQYLPASEIKKIAVIGAGPAGMTTAYIAAMRGHQVTLFEKSPQIGGQLNYAVKIPGKDEFYETLRYYRVMLDKYGVNVQLNQEVTVETFEDSDFHHIIVATGVLPKKIELEGIDHPKVLSYLDILHYEKPVGQKIGIIGAGGIGIDVAHYLTAKSPFPEKLSLFLESQGVLNAENAFEITKPSHPEVTMLQRKSSRIGKQLGKTTGWIHLKNLRSHGVQFITGVIYRKIDDEGLHITMGKEDKILPFDNVIISAGQVPSRSLFESLSGIGKDVHLIGGALESTELDAKRAIADGAELAARL